ncbi:MAG: prepilin-type N-terminal cleavage/methylation domain-containing protein [Armatimonadetes bacterium]|nr:prepilin-type N-terminal cleavage/methylation domain-containing protein [Candidatus Hippobium faecium]
MIKKGFSLIELLVVMAIIAILSAVIFPIMTSVREKTQQSKCIQNMKQIGMALEMFRSDNKKYPSGLAPEIEYNDDGTVVPMEETFGNLLENDYLKSYSVLHCPMDDRFEDTQKVCHVEYDSNNVSISKDLYAYSSYEKYINDDSQMDGDGVYNDPSAVLSYSREWSKTNKSSSDYARQLKWKNPPSNTVVCWCMNHAEHPYSNDQENYPTGGNALVLFLDGHVDVFTNVAQIAGSEWNVKPFNVE